MNESKSKLIEWLSANGWVVDATNGKKWSIVDADGNEATIIVTCHRDGSIASYNIA